MYTPLRIDPTKALGDIAAFQRKLAAGMGLLRSMREPEYANTPPSGHTMFGSVARTERIGPT